MVVAVSLGLCPSFDVFRRVLDGELVSLDEGLVRALDSGRRFLEFEASRRSVYGYCTGLGALAEHRGLCGPEWEHRVLVEHAVGVGGWAPLEVSRLFLFVRLLQMSMGYEPVRGILALRLVDALNSQITPLVPVRGSLGASGDLAPSAHAMLCVYEGQGLASYRGSIVGCLEALRAEGLQPLSLEPGESLALINNTAWSTATLVYAIIKLEDVVHRSLKVARETLEVCRCVGEHYDGRVSALKRHPGIARALEELQNPKCVERVRLQDPYSLRCTPFIYGALLEVIDYAKTVALREACSTSTNPVVVEGSVLHSCAFYAAHIAIVADLLSIAIAHVANVIERRIAQVMRGDITGLPDFLAIGGPVGAMIQHYVAAALTARIRALATPHSIHSIPVSGLQEDVVPQAGEATLRLLELVDLLEQLVSLEEKVVSIAKSLREASS